MRRTRHWGARWRELAPEDHDPYLVLWTLAHLVDREALPRPRVVVRFDLTDRRRPGRYWLLVGRRDRDVCVHDPGFGDDAVVTTDTPTLVRWHTGRIGVGSAAGRDDAGHRPSLDAPHTRRVGQAEALRRRRVR